MTASTARWRSGSSASPGTRYGIPAARILPLARTSRWAMVGSGTRKARAISAVDSPPSSRRVRATWTLRARAGWQQVKISRSRSSGTATSSAGSSYPCRSWAWACRSLRDASRRSRSIARFRAVMMIHPAGLGGIPAGGHRSNATVNASWTDSSARSMSPSTRTSTATARPYSLRKTCSIAVWSTDGTGPSVLGFLLERAHLDRRGAGLRGLGGPGQRGVEVLGLDHPEPADVLLALGERAVGHQHFAVLDPDHRRGARRVQASGEHPGPGGLDLRVQRVYPLVHRLHFFRRRGRAAVIDELHAEQVLLHRGSPLGRAGFRAGRVQPGFSRRRAPRPGPGGR